MNRSLPISGPLGAIAFGSTLTLLALVLGATPHAAYADGIVRQLSGKVEIGRGEPPAWSPATVDARIAPLERIRTGGDGRVELTLEAGTLRMHENSLLRIPAAAPDADRVELEAGHSLFDVLRRGGRVFEVRTPSVVVSVKGTRFGVDTSGDRGIVSVYHGVVGVRTSEAEQMVETLVREGFLAVGGRDLPIELDVAPEGDPWLDWQDLKTGARNPKGLEVPGNELERARTSMRRATDVDVLKRAAERRPEVAERLRQLKSQNPAGSPPAAAETATEASAGDTIVPASPGILDTIETGGDTETPEAEGGRDVFDRKGDRFERSDREGMSLEGMNDSSTGSLREVIEMNRSQEALAPVDTSVDIPAMTGGAPLGNGSTVFSTDHLGDHDPGDVMRLMNALQEMRGAADSFAGPWTDADMMAFLETQLVAQGMDAAVAAAMVQGLFR